MTLPPDARVIQVTDSGWYIIMFEPVPGVRIAYGTQDISGYDLGGRPMEQMTHAQAGQLGYIQGGDASELQSYAELAQVGSTYQQFFQKLLDQLFGPNDPARQDASVLRVIAEWAGRPDMAQSELMTLLERTPYWAARTDQQRRWSSLSPAEQSYQIAEWATRLADQYFQIVGERVDPNDDRIRRWAMQVASGARGESAIRSVIQQIAGRTDESPYNRQTRDEQEQQRQRGVDIENMTSQVRDLARRWGVQLTGDTMARWAQEITENRSSNEDLIGYLKQQAQILYPWKDPEMETASAAEPWLQTYGRVMEENTDLFNPEVQRALTNGESAWEFEMQLKSSDKWLQTRNATKTMLDGGATAARLMGFN